MYIAANPVWVKGWTPVVDGDLSLVFCGPAIMCGSAPSGPECLVFGELDGVVWG